jgi:DNA-directed RNA polymerase subunit K/omega
VVIRPVRTNPYEFVVVSALRAQQLLAGSTPRLVGRHNAATMAQMEVAAGRVRRADAHDSSATRQCRWQL